METMELTQDEIALVTKHRQQKEARAQQDVLTLYCLETAAKFEAWRQTGGYGGGKHRKTYRLCNSH